MLFLGGPLQSAGLLSIHEAQLSNCTGCGKPTTNVITIARLRLSLRYHPECAADAQRELRAILRWPDALSRPSGSASGPLPRADEI
jgi:hypothetical protein